MVKAKFLSKVEAEVKAKPDVRLRLRVRLSIGWWLRLSFNPG